MSKHDGKREYGPKPKRTTMRCEKCGLKKDVTGSWPGRAALRCMKCREFTIHEKEARNHVESKQGNG